MKANWTLAGVCTMLVLCAGPAAGQDAPAYKCANGSYSNKPCSKKVINAQPKAKPAAKKQGTFATRRLPGETEEEFALRRRRAHLSSGDQDECKRIDKKIPFEQERLKHSVTAEETKEATESIEDARKRYSKLRC